VDSGQDAITIDDDFADDDIIVDQNAEDVDLIEYSDQDDGGFIEEEDIVDGGDHDDGGDNQEPNSVKIFFGHEGSDDIAYYNLDIASGLLTPIADNYPTTANPRGFAIHPFLDVIYVVEGNLFQYAFDPESGITGEIAPSMDPGPSQADSQLAAHPSGNSLYVSGDGPTEGNLFQYDIDPLTGILSQKDPVYVFVDSTPSHVVILSAGDFAYVISRWSPPSLFCFSIDPNTEHLIALEPDSVVLQDRPRRIAVTPSEEFLYVSNRDSNTISKFQVDGTTGALTEISTPTASDSGPHGLAIESSGQYLYVSNTVTNTIGRYQIDQLTGELTEILPATPAGEEPRDIAFTPDGSLLVVVNYTSSDVSVFRLDETTKELEEIHPRVSTGTNPATLLILNR
jgi:6-phosphogluconolactonase (cycloisomerase 2 family)